MFYNYGLLEGYSIPGADINGLHIEPLLTFKRWYFKYNCFLLQR